MQLDKNPRESGFTLVELMVVVLVAAILVGIAVPSYQSQIRHSRRTDAKTALMDAAVREQKNMTLNNQFTTTATSLGYSALGVAIGNGYYTMYVCVGTATGTTSTTTACTANSGTTGSSFIVAAVPVAGTSQAKDTSCQYYAVDNTGTQFATNVATGPGGSGTDQTSTCWQ
jgi:type IV pilus assembly protein PilE